jgi:serine/threonine protein kinase
MKTPVNLEGSPEHVARLLVQHRVLTPPQAEHALASWRLAGGRRALRDILMEKGFLQPPLRYQVVRVFTKAVAECPKCATEYHIYFHHPEERHGCPTCKVPLPPPTPSADSTAPRMTPPSPVPGPAPAAKAPADLNVTLSQTILPTPEYDQTLLDMGGARRPAPVVQAPPAADPLASAFPGEAKPPAAGPDQTILPVPEYDQTLLDMGSASAARPTPPAAEATAAPAGAASPPPAPAAPPNLDATIVPAPFAEHTMLDLGTGSRGPAPAAAPPSVPREPSSPQISMTLMPTPDSGQTMLDMGGGAPAPLPEPPPEEPLSAADIKTVVIGGSSGTRGTSRRMGTSSTETAGGTGQISQASTEDITPGTRRGSTSHTGSRSHSKSDSIVGGVVTIASPKTLPPEVAAVAKDPKRLFGKYVLMKELGRGGAGVVYKAWDTLLQQYVALKFIRDQGSLESETTSGSAQIEEFQREARMSVKLRHPNIVRIYELGCMSNRYYLSMEYIEGGSLLEVIHGGKERNTKTCYPQEPEKFIKILQKVAEGVSYAHTLTPPVVHRDLKPHNVLVDKSGNPYVVDFGLAKEVELSEDGNTLTGVVKGTPSYMAPEQAEGRNRDVDTRSDVYSLGAILYEMLTGRPPFTAESVPELLRRIATEIPERPNDVIVKAAQGSPDTSKKPKPVPKPLETICLKALEKNKADRYQSAKDFAEDLERFLKNEDILATEPGLWRRIRRKIRQRPVLSGVAAAVLVTGLAAGVVIRLTRPTGGAVELEKLISGIVERGSLAVKERDWAGLKSAVDDLRRQAPKSAHLSDFDRILKEHEELVARTRKEWAADVERLKREPLRVVLKDLREKLARVPELKGELRESLRPELAALQSRLVSEARRIVGPGARPAWVEDLIKQSAKDTQDQVQTLAALAADPDLPYPVDSALEEARAGLARVIAYQGTWSLQVNVAPFAEVAVFRAGKPLAAEFTPLGLHELEVVGTAYTVEICWPSRADPQVRVSEEIRDLRHGQTVVIRGDIEKSAVKLERK